MFKKPSDITELSPEVVEFHTEICAKMDKMAKDLREMDKIKSKIEGLVVERGLKKAGVEATELKSKTGLARKMVKSLLEKLDGVTFTVYGKRFRIEPKAKTETFSYKGLCAEQLAVDEDAVKNMLDERKQSLPVVEIQPIVKAG